eukprot:tig00000042_g15544.t1
MTVSYEDALATLTAMFPTIDKEVIGAVLDSHQGHMENTIESLLAVSGENTDPNFQHRAPAAAAERESPPSRPGPRREGRPAGGSSLPPDFLGVSRSSGPHHNSQIDEDEMLARQLQEQIFREEMTQSRREVRSAIRDSEFYDARGAQPEPNDLEAIKQKLTSFGQAAKLKMKAIADKLSGSRQTATAGPGGREYSARYAQLGDGDQAEVVAYENEMQAVTAGRRVNAGEMEQEAELEDRRGQTRPAAPPAAAAAGRPDQSKKDR